MLLRRTLAAARRSSSPALRRPCPPRPTPRPTPHRSTTAIGDLTGRERGRAPATTRDLFPHWVDADGDGCSTRNEVLIAEADDPVTVGSGCSLSGGRWFSYYDRVSWTDTADVDIDHMVPLAEAWDSGARTWTTATRQAYANDLGDSRSLVGVTDNGQPAKGDQDPAEWLPHVRQVPLPARVGGGEAPLAADASTAAEKSAMTSLASSCTNTTITVTCAR